MSIRIGAALPSTDRMPIDPGVVEMARRLEVAGFDSIWVSDHVLLPKEISSRFPFSGDGRPPWPTGIAWYDTVVLLSAIAVVTERIELGTAVLLLALRNPLIAAKQFASVARLSRSRLTLGVGTGWLAEEFEAFGVPFQSRGERLEEWISIMRAGWSGRIGPIHGKHYPYLSREYFCLPRPGRSPQILIGGLSRKAVQRAGRLGDGWIVQQSAKEFDLVWIRRAISQMRAAATEAGRSDGESLRVVLKFHPSIGALEEIAERLLLLEQAGVHDVIVDIDWQDKQGPERAAALLRARGGERPPLENRG